MRLVCRRDVLFGALSVALLGCASSSSPQGAAPTDAGEGDAGTLGPLMTAAALAARLDDIKSGKLAVLHVGSASAFAAAHIAGAKSMGEASSADGARALSAALAQIPAETDVVVYCGCCTMANCLNVRPASAILRAEGRTNGYVLDLPNRFGADWIDKGYPIEKG